jgi:hypothetical protein
MGEVETAHTGAVKFDSRHRLGSLFLNPNPLVRRVMYWVSKQPTWVSEIFDRAKQKSDL